MQDTRRVRCHRLLRLFVIIMELSYPDNTKRICIYILTAQLIFMTLAYLLGFASLLHSIQLCGGGDDDDDDNSGTFGHAVCSVCTSTCGMYYNIVITVQLLQSAVSIIMKWFDVCLKSAHVDDFDESCPLTFP